MQESSSADRTHKKALDKRGHWVLPSIREVAESGSQVQDPTKLLLPVFRALRLPLLYLVDLAPTAP